MKTKGFTMIEVIIAIAISTVLFGSAYTVMNNGTKFFNQQSGQVFARNDVRLVLNRITQDIQESEDVTLNPSGVYIFTQPDGSEVSYSYDSTKKAVVRTVNTDESVFLDSVTSSFLIAQNGSEPNSYNIMMQTLNLKKYWGSSETEDHRITVTRRYGEPIDFPNPLTLRRDFSSNAQVGQEYSWVFSAFGGNGNYRYSYERLPNWLSSQDDTIAGTPTAAQTVTFKVTVTDDSNPRQSNSAEFTLNVAPSNNGREGDPFIDFNGDRIVNGADYYINLKVLSDSELNGYKYKPNKGYGYIYNGPGHLVIPKSPTVPNKYHLYLYAANGIVIKDKLSTQNNGHDIILVSNGPIYVDNVTLAGKNITVDSFISISKIQTKFDTKNLKLIVNGKNVNP